MVALDVRGWEEVEVVKWQAGDRDRRGLPSTRLAQSQDSGNLKSRDLVLQVLASGGKEGKKEGKKQIAVLEKVNAQPESHAGLACRFQGTTYTYVGRRSHVGAAEPKTMS